MSGLINRGNHIEQLEKWIDKYIFKVVTGSRRPGKSLHLQCFLGINIISTHKPHLTK